jgi:hypothetical protein
LTTTWASKKAWHAKSGPNSTQGFSLICSMHEITTSSDAPNQGRPYMQQIITTWVCASQVSITITTNHSPKISITLGRLMNHYYDQLDGPNLLSLAIRRLICAILSFRANQVLLHVSKKEGEIPCAINHAFFE